MPTVVEALTQAGQDLRDAVAAVLGLRSEYQTKFNELVSTVTNIITNFKTRPLAQEAWVDAFNGVDADGRGTRDLPFRSLDYALEHIDPSVAQAVYFLSDLRLERWHPVYSRLTLIGIARSAGNTFVPAVRKLSILGEATNSPRADLGRCMAFLDAQTSFVRTSYIDIVLPVVPDGVGWRSFFPGTGCSYSFGPGTISAETADTAARLIAGANFRTTVMFAGAAIGADMAGKLFEGVPAGTDPNALFQFSTNVTSG